MIKLVATRIGLGLVTLFIAVSGAFFLVHSSGSPAVQILGESASPERVAALNHQLGLDRPLVVQYLGFLGQLVRGDLGESLRYAQPNATLIMERLPATVELAAAALLIALVVGVPLGALAATREGRLADRLVSAVSLVGVSMPIFWIGLMAILFFAVRLHWLPAGQRDGLASLVLPAVTLSALPLAQIARLTRSSMSETLRQQFITASRARGLSAARVVINHALRNSAIPVLTIFGLQTGLLLSGAVTVEFVFSWPGLGTLATNAVQGRDFTLVQAVVVVGVAVFVITNLVVDVLYGIIDPRIRDGRV
ncbi:ABC transporter permease [Nonomuraea sp. K274]|uniref:ABC transporter permease n=1 Tax=Nonomuraea cypriaca TaxID=1187855 RepID=A0A931AIX0_9ACTN|nr:ABC transporter permease [Nonomuraea cypriaca]MBF8191829.1 ABC transporter permease [Nonomuraea cypriaca]